MVGLCYSSSFYRESLNQCIVHPGQTVKLINGEVAVINKSTVVGYGKFLVQYKLRRKASGDIEKIEFTFIYEPKQIIQFEMHFNSDEFNFQPELKNASFSIRENNKISIASTEPAQTSQTIKLALTRRN